MKNLIQNLGLCRKAGALVYGFDAVVEAMQKNKACGVLTASDISAKTLKEINFHAEKNSTEVKNLNIDSEELKTVTGKSTVVIAITDIGLYTLFGGN